MYPTNSADPKRVLGRGVIQYYLFMYVLCFLLRIEKKHSNKWGGRWRKVGMGDIFQEEGV